MRTSAETNIERIKLAEHQFRLACTVHLAVTNGVQTLDVPVEWTFGRHRVSYDDFGLREDQAPLAASALEHTSMLVLASTIRDAIVGAFENPKEHSNRQVVTAYQIARISRNAFAHSMVDPVWSIDADCRDKTFEIDGIISLCTSSLHCTPMHSTHYGGPLAIFKFGRFVREVLLECPVDPNREKPKRPTLESYQQGRLIVTKI
jgi:hypothetical protein